MSENIIIFGPFVVLLVALSLWANIRHFIEKWKEEKELCENIEDKPKKPKKMFKHPKIVQFVYWVIVDLYRHIKYGKEFKEYGVTMYSGRQGSGKTIGMVKYLEDIKEKYPDVMIITNFGYVKQDKPMESWEDLINIRNGKNGVVFAIDELQNEWDSSKWDKFPEFLLRQITMQRKQRVKIVASSQVYTRVVKAIREQCYEVVECWTLLGRWSFYRCFDADDYNQVVDNPEKKIKLFRKWRKSFIQTDKFRMLYDTDLVIEKLKDYEPSQLPSKVARRII